MKINVEKKQVALNVKAGDVLHATSTMHGVEDTFLFIIRIGEFLKAIELSTGSEWKYIEMNSKTVALTPTLNEMQQTGKYKFTKVNAEMTIKI